MNYLDPYQLLELEVSGPEEVTAEMLAAAQAKLAEKIAQTTGDENAGVVGKISKAEAQALAAAMNDPQARRHFWEMAHNPALSKFLSENQAAPLQSFQLSHQDLPADYVAFASTWVAKKIDDLLGTALKTSRWADALLLLRNLYRIDGTAYGPALVQAEAYFEGLRMEMENVLSASEGRPVMNDSRKYYQATMLGVLNTLPDICQSLRDQYAITLGRWAVTLAKWQKQSETPYLIAVAASKIVTSEHVASNLKTMQLKLKDDTGITDKDKQALSGAQLAGWGGAGGIILVIIIRVIIMLMRH